VYVFSSAGGSWSQQQVFAGIGGLLAASGDTAVVGDPAKQSAHVFARTGSSWSEQQTMAPGGNGSIFGSAVAISGDTVIVGSNDAPWTTGVAHVFVLGSSAGDPCTSPGQCTSGFCVDGVCCDTACADACHACSAAAGASNDGTCTPLTGTPCSDGHACTQGDTCQGGACASGTLVTTGACTPVCVTVQRGVSGEVEDALLASNWPATNWGSSQSLVSGSVPPGERQALLRFDLSAIPSDAIVLSAEATLNVLLYGGAPVRAHVVTAPWSEGAVTWDSFNGAYLPAVAATFPAAANAFPHPPVPTSTDVAALVQAWLNGSVPNDGLLLERDLTGSTVFCSSEFTTPSERPKLSTCYVPGF
jgi:hypothetical protein